MNLNNTPASNRLHIGLFGKRNAGKSSVLNAITGQSFSIVSDIKGTTTDPVLKSMELLPLGPVIIIDTPGLDDTNALGSLRVEKAYQMLNKTDIALLVVDATLGISSEDYGILKKIQEKDLPYLIVLNKADLIEKEKRKKVVDNLFIRTKTKIDDSIFISTKTGENIHELKEAIAKKGASTSSALPLVHDLFSPNEVIVLVTPIDSAAPKGRLILPQQQTIRDILDYKGIAITTTEHTLSETLASLKEPPALVITDSQAFELVSQIVPEEVPLTSFSILFARHRGDLEITKSGAFTLDELEDDDTVLICEGCTHHRQCDDIGTVKLPNLLRKHTKKALRFEFTSGAEFPDKLSDYKLIIHCGACMLNEKEMKYRLSQAVAQNVAITNYGMAFAYILGIFERGLRILD